MKVTYITSTPLTFLRVLLQESLLEGDTSLVIRFT